MSMTKPKSASVAASTDASLPPISPFVPSKSSQELAKLHTTLGAQQVKSRKEIQAFSKSDWRKIADREYVTMYEANLNTATLLESTMNDGIPVWCKEVRLAQCTPRYRANLLERSLPIQRYLLRGGQTVDVYDEHGGPTKCRHFLAIFNLFLADNVLYMFMVPRKAGSLHDRLKDRKAPPKPSQIRQWIGQLVKAVGVMHDYGVAHRSLKLQHVLLHGSALDVQVTSWNRAVHYWDETTEPGQTYLLLQNRERRSRKNRHFPPECFSCPSTSGYDPSKVDLWSVGVIAVALATRRYPFNPHCKYNFRAQWTSFLARHAFPCEYLKETLAVLFKFDPLKRQPARMVLKRCQYFDPKLDLNKLAESRKKSLDSGMPLTRPKTKTFSCTPVNSSQPSAVKTATGKTKPLKRSTSQDSKSSIKSQATAKSQTKMAGSKGGTTHSKNNSRTSSNKTLTSSKPKSTSAGSKLTSGSTSSNYSGGSKSTDKPKSRTTKMSRSSSKTKSSSSTNIMAKSDSKSSVKSNSSRKSVGISVTRSGSLTARPRTPATATGRKPEVAYDPGQDHASGDEGGAVDENLPPEERNYEDMEHTRKATEESESQARVIRVKVNNRSHKS